MEIGQAIKKLRKEKGFGQKDLADKCDISVNSLSQIEIGNTFPKQDNLKKVCDALGVPVAYLLLSTLDDEEFPEGKRVVLEVLIKTAKDVLVPNRVNVC